MASPQVTLFKLISNAATLSDHGIYVQIGVSDKRMRFSSTYFKHWLAQQGFPQRVFTEALIRQFGMCTVRGRLGAGTYHQGGALEYLFEIDLTNPAAAGFFDA